MATFRLVLVAAVGLMQRTGIRERCWRQTDLLNAIGNLWALPMTAVAATAAVTGHEFGVRGCVIEALECVPRRASAAGGPTKVDWPLPSGM